MKSSFFNGRTLGFQFSFLMTVLATPLEAQKKPTMQNNLDTIFHVGLRDYNQRTENPMTVAEAQQRTEIFYRAIERFSSQSPGDFVQLKAGFEVAMVASNSGTPMLYNRDAVSVYDALCEGKANCAAGTNLYIGGAVRAWGEKEIRDRHLAVIFSEGHVQAGYFQRNDGGGWDLHRVETTATAVQPQSLGETTNLTAHGPLRVLLVEDYLEIEANRHSGVPNPRIMSEMLPQALDQVAQYGVPVNELEALIRQAPPSGGGAGSINATPLAFGSSDVPPGDRERGSSPGLVNSEWRSGLSSDNLPKHPWAQRAVSENPDWKIIAESILSEPSVFDISGGHLHLSSAKQRLWELLREQYDGVFLQPHTRDNEGSIDWFWPNSSKTPDSNSLLYRWSIGGSKTIVQDAIERSLRFREIVLRHPDLLAATESQPDQLQRVHEFYDRELIEYVGALLAPQISEGPYTIKKSTPSPQRSPSIDNYMYLQVAQGISTKAVTKEVEYLLTKLPEKISSVDFLNPQSPLVQTGPIGGLELDHPEELPEKRFVSPETINLRD